MNQAEEKITFETVVGAIAPALFVVLWSTGFIGTKYALAGAEPFTYLAIRMVAVVAIMVVIVAITRPVWLTRIETGHSIVAGLLVHGIYLAGTSVAIYHSVPAGLSALIPGLQPILTSTLANRFLGERVTPLQWSGLLLGLSGVLLVLHTRSLDGQLGWGWLGTVVALISITLGTLYQKRFCTKIDWRSGNLVQFIAAGIFYALGAFLFETREVTWSREFILGVLWLVLLLSIGSISLLYWLLRRNNSTQVASLFYLVPATTALMAYVLFDERLSWLGILGMVICAAGVFLVNKPQPKTEISPGA